MTLNDGARGLGWPTFELVRVPSGPGVPPSVERGLAEVGIPRGLIGQEYQMLPEAVVLADSGRLIAIGTCGPSGRICIDAASEHVVHVPTLDGTLVNEVNSSLDLFRNCVAAIIARFPFYGEEDDPAEFEAVAEEVRSIVSSLDDLPMGPDGFWTTFADDVAIGDYATEIIVVNGE